MMVTDALQRRALPRAGAIATSWGGSAVLLALLVAASLFARTRALDAPFWIDEGLSVGIASFPLLEIPGVLRQDGSPPLYYMLLHLWIDLFDSRSEAATHALSVFFAVLAVPAALWAGWSLFGRRAGWIAASLAAINPFLTIYAQETRMYSLVILLSFVASGAFVHAFVFRRRRYVPVFAATLAVMLYTHNWALFFILAALVALALCLRETRERRGLVVDGAFAFGGAALVYVPWVPTLVFQALHTGAPWSRPPSPLELIGALYVVLSGDGAVVALVLGAGGALLRIVRGPASPERTAVIALVALALGTLLSGWLYSQFSPAWAVRYLGMLLGPVFLLAAVGLPRAGRLGLVALALVVLFWAPFRANDEKSNARELAAQFETYLEPGDLVISTQPEQVPVLDYYLPSGLRYATPIGPVRETRVMDWRDAVSKLEAARPETTLAPLLDAVPVGRRVMVVRPVVRDEDAWKAEWTSLVRRRSYQWAQAIARDERFTRTASAVPPFTEDAVRALRVDLFTKTKTG